MTSLLAINQDSVSAVRRPVFEVNFASDDSPGGLAAAVELIQGADDSWTRSVNMMNVVTGLAPGVDFATIEIASDEQAPQVALDNAGSVSLGYGDSGSELVFTAMVNDLRHNVRGTQRLNGVNGGAALSQLRINQSHEQQTAGDLVDDLCSQAGVATDVIESGIDLPFYVIDDRYNAYEHIDRLARQSGYIAYFTPQGGLYFGPEQTGRAVQTFRYAENILALRIQQNKASAVAATVVGEGAAGAQGQDAWSWLVKDPAAVTAESGDGRPRLISNAALRSSSACQTAAQGFAARSVARALTGQILTPGAPAVTVGSTIRIADAPNEQMNGDFFVSRVCHRYAKRAGFTSRIDFRQAGESGGLLSELGL